ncbi:MAG TPA: DUF6263 family protein [Ferruginibacter sp.]|nr:DUF6263 family protein [Ferruginibacter sp.]HRE64829.1 DUF6263 family protein [Ferruginibacter sp.]
MKKNVLFLAICAATFNSNAQTVQFKKGQLVTISNSSTQEIDMGMAGQMNNSSKLTSILEIKEVVKNSYKAIVKVSKLSMSFDAMGEQQTFDSEKEADMQNEIGKSLGTNIGKEFKIEIDNNTGKVTTEKKADTTSTAKNDNPLEGIMNMTVSNENNGALAESIIFVLPTYKKAGDSWQDSSEVKNDARIYKTYTLKSVQDGMATLGLISKSNGKTTTEAQGMQIDLMMDIKSDAELLVDTKTSIIKKITRTINIDGSMEVMGQSLPITAKTTELVEVN